MTSPARTETVLYSIFDRPIQSARVLIIDDDQLMRDLLSRYLRQEGYTIETAQNGAEGLAKFDEFSPDVICLDYQMPGMSGHDVARELRARKELLYVPIVMLTASGDHLKLDSLESGVDAFLTKPTGRAELKVTIRTLLRMKLAQDTMLAALDRVAEVQDDLLEYERLRGQAEAMQATVAACVHELSGPLLTAQLAAQGLENDSKAANIQQRQVADLKEALEKATDIIQRMSTFHLQ